MISLSEKLDGENFIYISPIDRNRLSPLLDTIKRGVITDSLNSISDYSKIILDKRAVDKDFFEKYLKGANIFAIDEGGPFRDKFPYLIDILPLPDRFSTPNVHSISFLDLPDVKPQDKNGKILVSFGGEDPKCLTEKFCHSIITNHKDLISSLTIILGPLYNGKDPDSCFNVIRNPENFQGLLTEYSGVICSFGISAFEANLLGIPVLLINPGEYHKELGRLSGFLCVEDDNRSKRLIHTFVTEPQNFNPVKMKTNGISLASFINDLADLNISCPVCSSHEYTVKARFPQRTYNRCDRCHMVYMLNYSRNKIVYNQDYFFDQYENQYGKTYLEDFDHLSSMAEERLKLIRKCNSHASTILDAGCAYGPFLKKSEAMGFRPFGTDISGDAVRYVKDQLNIPAQCCEFHNFIIPESWELAQFDILTMWYVIEHFSELSRILKKINSLLKVGGIFAFSTPSGSGISIKNSEVDFFLHSPDDHYTIWEPENCQSILELFGFRVVKKRITGHHPERFRGLLSKTVVGRAFLMKISRLFKYGDTFEVYAEKVREL